MMTMGSRAVSQRRQWTSTRRRVITSGTGGKLDSVPALRQVHHLRAPLSFTCQTQASCESGTVVFPQSRSTVRNYGQNLWK